MAESSVLESWKTTTPCRFFANGMCREGERCKYLHEEHAGQILSEESLTKNLMKDVVTASANPSDALDRCLGASGSSVRKTNSANDASSSRTFISNSITSNEGASNSTSIISGTELVDSNVSSSLDGSSSGGVINNVPVVCHFYLQGRCMFGNNCRNKHVTENSESSSILNRPDDSSSISMKDSSATTSGALESVETECLQHISNTSPATKSFEDQEQLRSKKQLALIEPKTCLRVNAPEFVPSGFMFSQTTEAPTEKEDDTKEGSSGKTWAQVVNATAGNGVPSPNVSLCPYAEAGECPYAERCTYLHGDVCEFCGHACLHPTNESQRKSHTDECIKQHEREMEHAFAVARSRDKQCGVCFEVVVDKNPATEQRFGILPNCNHCFCLACIRKWRQAKQFENKIIRACPECRVTSDFVCPSMYWVDTKEEKEKLIKAYKDALSNKQCKYFRQGQGKCPFGNKCFYLHANPDGTKVDTGPPIRRQRQNADGDTDVLQLFLWDFLDERDNRWLYSLDDLDLVAFLSNSEDSESSDIEIF